MSSVVTWKLNAYIAKLAGQGLAVRGPDTVPLQRTGAWSGAGVGGGVVQRSRNVLILPYLPWSGGGGSPGGTVRGVCTHLLLEEPVLLCRKRTGLCWSPSALRSPTGVSQEELA